MKLSALGVSNVFLFVLMGLETGCSKSNPTAAASANSKVSVNILNLSKATPKTMSLSNKDSVGTNAATDLTSLKYAFNAISLCKSTDATSAFGYTTETGCISLYSNMVASGSDETMTIAGYLNKYAGTANVFDLMSLTDLARLNATPVALTTDQTGDYNYAILTWVPLIGVQGSVTLPDATVLSTSSQGTIGANTGSGPVTTVSNLVSATPTTTYIQSANGGMVTKFQKPLTITAGTNYSLEIIFNPAGVLKGCSGSTSGNITDGTNSITMPMLPVTAVMKASTDYIMRESYTVNINSNFNVRIELYYLKSDTSKSVLAATITDLPSYSTPNSCYGGDHRVMIVKAANDGSLGFYSFATATTAMVSGLVRGSNAVGATITFNTVLDANGYTGLPGSVSSGTVTAVTTTEY